MIKTFLFLSRNKGIMNVIIFPAPVPAITTPSKIVPVTPSCHPYTFVLKHPPKSESISCQVSKSHTQISVMHFL